MKKRIFIGLLFTLVILIIYVDFNSYAANYSWKHGGGAHIGGWIEFNDVYKLKKRMIFKNENKVGFKLFSSRSHLFILDYSMHVGMYINKGEKSGYPSRSK